MRQRVVLIGGMMDTALRPMSNGPHIERGETLAQELKWPNMGPNGTDLIYNHYRTVKATDGGNIEVYMVHPPLDEFEIFDHLVRNYGKYESIVAHIESIVRRENENMKR